VTAKPDLPIIPFASRDAWGAWLEGQHATSDGLWLKFAKKYSGLETVTYDQAVEIALCYGWIDGQVRSFDEDYYLQRFTPRRPRSRCTPQGPNPEQPGWPTSSNHRLVSPVERAFRQPWFAYPSRASRPGSHPTA
jgi:hypothetical protein